MTGAGEITIKIVKSSDGAAPVYEGRIVKLGSVYTRNGKQIPEGEGYVRFHLLPDETRANGVPTFRVERRVAWRRDSSWSEARGPSKLNAEKGLIHGLEESWVRKP